MVATVHILILAAGASSRMRGADKLVQPVNDMPMLRHIATVALATGCPVTVTLPPDATARLAALEGLQLNLVPVPDASEGMSRSLVHADMPGFTTAALQGLVEQFQSDPTRILRGGTMDGQPGHPAIFPHDLWPALERVTGDEGGRSVLQRNKGRVRVIPLPGQMSVLDLDTPEDWAAWQGDA